MEVEIIRILVCCKQFLSVLCSNIAYRHRLHREDIELAGALRQIEVGNAEAAQRSLAGEVKRGHRLGNVRAFWLIKMQAIALCLAGEIAVDDLGLEELFRYDPLLPGL